MSLIEYLTFPLDDTDVKGTIWIKYIFFCSTQFFRRLQKFSYTLWPSVMFTFLPVYLAIDFKKANN